MMRGFLAILLWLAMAVPSFAANHYVRAGASGSANGSDWTNACTDFSGSCAVSSLVRGDTYYVGTGTYASVEFTTAESGSLVITVKGATAADHGTSTGWNAAYGVDVTQAEFQFNSTAHESVTIQTSYFTFDGNTGSGSTVTSYGFKLQQPASCSTSQDNYFYVGKLNTTQTTTDVTVKHVAAPSCGASFDVTQLPFVFGSAQAYVTNSIFAYLYASGGNKAFQITNVANSTLEHSWTQDQWSSASHHGETISINNCHNSDVGGCSTACTQGSCAINNTIRHNVFKNCRGTACIAALDPGYASSMPGTKIYGNVFVDSTAGNGVIATGSSGAHYMQDVLIYNNTFIDIASNYIVWQCGSSTPCASTSGNVFQNNILYNSTSVVNEDTGGAITKSYNSYLSATDTPSAESNGQIATLDPFVSYATGDYRLTNDTSVNAGVTLSSPYDTDPNGITRGASNWNRGAFEYVVGVTGSGVMRGSKGLGLF